MYGSNSFRFATKCALSLVLVVASCNIAVAGTKVVTFGWEDGTSTTLGEFIAGGSAGVSYANVTAGSEVDYGPTAAPFPTPVVYNVTPIGGSRMLEINIDPVDEGSSNAVRPYMAHLQNLDDGDTIQYSMKYFDPSDGRSPSVLADGVYGTDNSDINSFAGFFTPFQCFAPGDGWLDVIGDAACDDVSFPVDPNMVFDDGAGDDRVSVTLRAQAFRPTLSTLGSGGNGTYKFYIDELRISVTSDNPDASITLPDGSVTMVNGMTTIDADFNDDTVIDGTDIDLLTMDVANGDNDVSMFDLDGSGTVDYDDVIQWLADAGEANLASMNSYIIGDANLDGTVDGQDFVAWNSNKFTTTGKWTQGDFNADGPTDGQDFVLWNNNKFTSADGVSSVPEPAAGLLTILLGVGLFTARRR